MPSEAEEDNKRLSSFVRKKPTNANNVRELKKEEIDDNKPIKSSSLSGSLPKPDKMDDEKPVSKGLGGQFQTTCGGILKLTLDFFSHVNETFHHEPAKFKKFAKILKAYKVHRIDEASTLAKLVQLLKEHDHLLRAFAVLVPEANITVPPEAMKRKRAHQSDETDFTNKPKTRSQSRRDTDTPQHVY